MLRVAIAALLAATMAWVPAQRASALDSTRQAALILRILSYDRNLPDRADGRITLLVVYRDGHSHSEREQSSVVSAVNGLGRRVTVSGMRTRAVSVPYSQAANLAGHIRRHRASAVYICDGLASKIGEIRGTTRDTDTLTLTSSASAVRHGLSVGLVPKGSSIGLLINLRAVRAEGSLLDAAVLRLADVIR